MRYVSNAKGEKIVIARSAELVVADDMGRERERHKLPYGALLMVDDGSTFYHMNMGWKPTMQSVVALVSVTPMVAYMY